MLYSSFFINKINGIDLVFLFLLLMLVSGTFYYYLLAFIYCFLTFVFSFVFSILSVFITKKIRKVDPQNKKIWEIN